MREMAQGRTLDRSLATAAPATTVLPADLVEVVKKVPRVLRDAEVVVAVEVETQLGRMQHQLPFRRTQVLPDLYGQATRRLAKDKSPKHVSHGRNLLSRME